MTEKQKAALRGAAVDCFKPLRDYLGLSRGFHLFLFDFFGLVHQLVGLF